MARVASLPSSRSGGPLTSLTSRVSLSASARPSCVAGVASSVPVSVVRRPTVYRATELPSFARRGAVVVDLRTAAERARHGILLGALALAPEETADLLLPQSPHRLALAEDPEREWVLVSLEGDIASFVATTLVALGVRRVGHIAGGFHAVAASRMLLALTEDAGVRRDVEQFSAHSIAQ